MRFLRNGYLGLLTFAVGCVTIVTPTVEAQFFDGKLPKLFNRGRDEPGREPITRDSPDIVFTRDYGIPAPYSTKIETIKGFEVSFFIYAKTKTPGMRVEFLVRDFPSAGKLISIVSNPENRSSGIVTYLADPNSGATMDAFTFAARYPSGQYSSPARCDIQIKDAQAMIEVTPEADFGTVMIGSMAEQSIVITNRGNAPYTTTLNLSSPWRVISPKGGQLQLGPGSQTKVTVGFDPTFAGPANYNLMLNRSDDGTCKFKGEAKEPFKIQGEEWELAMNPETGRRECEVVVISNNERPFEVFLRSSPRLKTKTSEYTVLIPGKENRIGVYLEKDDVMAFDGGLEIKMKEGYKEVTSVFSDTVPSNLVVEIPGQLGHEVINFGKVTAGRSSECGIILKNTGGELMSLDVSVSEPFQMLTKTDRQLVPLDSMPVSIGFYPHKSDRGGADQVMTLRTNRQEIKIRLVGIALRPAGIPRAAPLVKKAPSPPAADPAASSDPTLVNHGPSIGNGVPTSQVTSPDRLKATPPTQMDAETLANYGVDNFDLSLSPLGVVTKGIVKRELAPGLKSPVDIELLGAKAKSLEIGWTAPKGSEIDNFELEMRGQRVNPITSHVESVWAPYSAVEYKRVGRLVKAKVKELSPFTFYEFRVFTVDQNGRSSPSSDLFVIKTTRSMDWTYIYIALGLIVLGFLGWGIVKIVRERRGEVYHSEFVE